MAIGTPRLGALGRQQKMIGFQVGEDVIPKNKQIQLNNDPDQLTYSLELILSCCKPSHKFPSHTGAAGVFNFSRPAEGVPTLSIVVALPLRVFFRNIPVGPNCNVLAERTGRPLAELFPRVSERVCVPIKLVTPKTGHCSLSSLLSLRRLYTGGELEPGACFQLLSTPC